MGSHAAMQGLWPAAQAIARVDATWVASEIRPW
jgi:hypothetical protein